MTDKRYYGVENSLNTSTYQWVASTPAYKTYQYDKNGNVLKEFDGGSFFTTYTYSPLGKLTSKLDPIGSANKLSYTEKYDYDVLGRQTTITKVKNVGSSLTGDIAKGVVITNTYSNIVNGAGNVDGIKVSKSVTSNDGLTGINSTVEDKYFDLAGNIVSLEQYRDGSTKNRIDYKYNGLNKVAMKTQYITDLDDTLANNVDKTATTLYRYNALGALVYTQNRMDTKDDTRDDICEKYRYDFWGNVLDSGK